MRRLVPLVLLAACARPPVHVTGPRVGVAAIDGVRVEVVDASPRPLAASRFGLVEEVGRVTGGRHDAPPSAVDAFRAAAAATLENKGLGVRSGPGPGLAVLRVTLRDIDVRGRGASGAVAFVTARYALESAAGEPLWEAVETRLPIGLGGPDLTSSQLARVATEAVRHALRSLPAAPGH
jgi:hypothetical protein